MAERRTTNGSTALRKSAQRAASRDRKRRKRMPVHGSSVKTLKRIIDRKAGKVQKRLGEGSR